MLQAGDKRAPSAPYFSIVMPMYNREALIRRALDSCLSQSFIDFEIVVVDDGSVDGSYDVVSGYRDSRIRLFRHSINRGVCPTRNTAIANSVGMWLIFLDSDDELLPGALAVMHARTSTAMPDIENIRFMCRFDSGELSPDPAFNGAVLDYRGYIRWLETASRGRHEALICIRRRAFETLSFPDGRAMETMFHLDFAGRFLTLDCPDVVRLYHQDAANSLCTSFSAQRVLESAPDQAAMHTALLQNHGDALRMYAPSLFLAELRVTATSLFLSGKRREGWRHSLKYLRASPCSPGMIAILLAGMCGRSAIVFAKWLSAELRRRMNTKARWRRV